MEKGGKAVAEFEKYTEQMLERFYYSPQKYYKGSDQIVFIADYQEFQLSQLTHGPSKTKIGSSRKYFIRGNF